eukprot:3542064-Rhodomonas_salina.3
MVCCAATRKWNGHGGAAYFGQNQVRTFYLSFACAVHCPALTTTMLQLQTLLCPIQTLYNAMLLGIRYAVSGTDIRYAVARSLVMSDSRGDHYLPMLSA